MPSGSQVLVGAPSSRRSAWRRPHFLNCSPNMLKRSGTSVRCLLQIGFSRAGCNQHPSIRDVPCQTVLGPVGQWFGRAGPCQAGPAPRPLTSIGQAWPAQPLTFINRTWASLANKPSLLLANPSLLLARPSLLSARPDPPFLLTNLSLLSAKPGRAMPNRVGPCRAVSAPCRTVPRQAWLCRRVGLTLAHP